MEELSAKVSMPKIENKRRNLEEKIMKKGKDHNNLLRSLKEKERN